jgi:adenylate cyclase
MTVENERRFLLAGLPHEDPVDQTTIRQAYWRLGGGWSLRVRREGRADDDTRNSITVKGPWHGVSRPEFSLFLADDATGISAVESLFRAASGNKIVKTRFSYLIDGLTWDVDQFHWENEGLIIAELEMDDPVALAKVARPGWTVREVTGEVQYANDHLAFHPFKSW